MRIKKEKSKKKKKKMAQDLFFRTLSIEIELDDEEKRQSVAIKGLSSHSIFKVPLFKPGETCSGKVCLLFIVYCLLFIYLCYLYYLYYLY